MMEQLEENSWIITDKFKFKNPHTKAYVYELVETSAFVDDYFIEMYIMIPSDDAEILDVMKYMAHNVLGIKYNNALKIELKKCLAGRDSFRWPSKDSSTYITIVCGDRGQGTYFRIYDNV